MQSERANINQFDELLIESVRKFPVLYDSSSKNNKNKKFRDNAWKLLADELKSTVEECKRRWKILRDAFVKYQNATRQTPSGSAAATIRKPPFADSLQFLISTIKHRKGSSNLTNDSSSCVFEEGSGAKHGDEDDDVGRSQTDEDIEECDGSAQASDNESDILNTGRTSTGSTSQPISEQSQNIPQPRAKLIRNKKAHIEQPDKDIIDAIRDASSKSAQDSVKDEMEMYALSLVPTLRRLSPYKLAYLKAKLSALMLEIEFNLPDPSAAHQRHQTSIHGHVAHAPTYTQLRDMRGPSVNPSSLINPFTISSSDRNYTYSAADLSNEGYTADD